MKEHKKIIDSLKDKTNDEGITKFERLKLNGLNKTSGLISPGIARTGLHYTFLQSFTLSDWLIINALSPK